MLIDQIRLDMVAAMRAGEQTRLATLRMLVSEINYKKIELQREMTDADVAGVVAREVKKRREAVESYQAGGRPEQAEQERQEMAVLEDYLPQMMSEAEVRKELESSAEIKAAGDFGQKMKVAAPLFKGRADGAMVAKIVKELCQ